MTAQRMPLGTLLLNQGLIDKKTLDKALNYQEKTKREGKPMALGEILVRSGHLQEVDLDRALRSQARTQSEVLTSRLEVEEIHGQITVQGIDQTTSTPFVDDSYAGSILVAENSHSVPIILVTPEFREGHKNVVMAIRHRVETAYSEGKQQRVRPKILPVTADLLDVYRKNDINEESSVIKTDTESEFEQLVKLAYSRGAVDLHFFRKATTCVVRFRINGKLRTYTEWTPEKADSVIGVGFQSFGKGSKYDSWRAREAQRIRLKIRVNQHVSLDCRYEHAPGDDGAYHACIRILANDKREITKQIDLCSLGFTRAHHHALEAATSESSGLILLSGPTGSGKSTTMAGLIKYINRNDDVNVLTVESPIERELPAFQTAVSDDESNPKEFANAIKSMLRRDPDFGMVGEIRDEMSASAVATGVQTGHVMLSTVHAQSAIEIVERLASPAMKVPVQTIGSPSFLNALVFQKLLPVLDEATKVRITPANIDQFMDSRQKARFLKLFPDYEHKKLFAAGYSEANPEGIGGMTICAEIVIPDDTMRGMFRRMELAEALMYWRKRGSEEEGRPLDERIHGLTAADHAIAKVEQGLIDPRDLEDSFGYMDRLASRRRELRRQLQAEAA